MKKYLCTAFSLCVLFISGCGQKDTTYIDSDDMDTFTSQCIPPWEQAIPVSKEGIYGKGRAIKQKNLTLTRNLADQKARQDIVQLLKTKTAPIITSFLQHSSVSTSMGSTNFASQLSDALLQEPLQGSYIDQRYICPDGTVYSLAFYPIATYKENIVETAQNQDKIKTKNKHFADIFTKKEQIQRLHRQIDEELLH